MMDTLWMFIVTMVQHGQQGLNILFSPLHMLGPTAAVAGIAVLTAAVTRVFGKKFKTKRYKELEQEFYYWYDVKQQALQLKDADPEKAKQLGRNIDQGHLNKVYYDFFFEGFLKNLLTMYIPLFLMLGYVNATYAPEALEAMTGKSHLFILPWFNGQQYPIGAVFWFVCCVLFFYVAAFVVRMMLEKKQRGTGSAQKAI
jgi:hypothetical protein